MNASSSRSVRRRAGAVAAVALCGTAWLGVTSVQAAPPPPRPNLVVTAGRLSLPDAPEWGFAVLRGSTTLFAWHQRTKNEGEAPTHKISHTGVRLILSRGHADVGGGGRLAVPRLGVGKSVADNSAFRIFWKWSDWDYGTYYTRICADIGDAITESHEKDNCHKTHTIYVVPGGLEAARITGTATNDAQPGLTLTWTTAASFVLKKPGKNVPDPNIGVLEYSFHDFTPGEPDVQYKLSGTEPGPDGCTWDGTGGYSPNEPFDIIKLGFGRRHNSYSGTATVAADFHFPATVTCPRQDPFAVDIFPAEWGSAISWLNTGPTKRFPDPGLTQLKGHYAVDNVIWNWNLLPVDAPN